MSRATGATRVGAALLALSTAALGLQLVRPPAVGADGNANLHLGKTVTSAALSPNLAIGLGVDKTSAIPGDVLTYTATVSNTGATLTVRGDLTAQNTDATSNQIASYYDAVSTTATGTCGVTTTNQGNNTAPWTPRAGTAAAQSGYTPIQAAPIGTGLSLSLQPVAASGVTYPAAGDPILGTQLAAGATATWHYTATVTLSPSQVGVFLDPKQVSRIRNTLHAEMTPRKQNGNGQPASVDTEFCQQLASTSPSGTAHNVAVTFTPPEGAGGVTVPAGDLAPGASETVKDAYTVAQVAAKTATESDAEYLTRLQSVEGTALSAGATVTATGSGGAISAGPATSPVTAEHLPIVGIAKTGPASADAGTSPTYSLALNNGGGAGAGPLSVVDTLPDGSTGTVTGVPATLNPGDTATASATAAIPAAQTAGPLTDTASVTWKDANGNVYGPVSSEFTTTVTSSFAGSTLTLSPSTAGPDVTGTNQVFTAVLLDHNGAPIAGKTINFAVTGVNPHTGTGTTNQNGLATFSYAGANDGADVVQATFTAGTYTAPSNTGSVEWITPVVPISTGTVTGNFFAEPSSATSFVAKPGDTPAFGQDFPTIDFNPPSGIVNHNISGVGPTTRPFTDVTTDPMGNYMGTIVAQGNGYQAGVGALSSFDAVLNSNFVVANPGDVTFHVVADEGFLLGIGNGAARVSGAYENAPASNSSAFNGYPLVGAYNQQGGSTPGTYTVTVHFPAAGTYPFEIDYFECCGQDLSLTLSVVQFTADTSPLSVYAGYADGLRPAGSIFPFPWLGSPNVTFEGCQPNCGFDAAAVRLDNSGTTPMSIDKMTVDFKNASTGYTCSFDIWPHGLTLPPGQIMIFTQTVSGASSGCDNRSGQFDTSDLPYAGYCGQNGIIPQVNVTIDGVTQSFTDSDQVLDTKGEDTASCPGRNESASWSRIGGGGTPINVPLPPATTLNLTPTAISGADVGAQQVFTVTALDGSGKAVPNLPVTLQVFGANTQQLTGSTDADGVAHISYAGANAGTDTVAAYAFIGGLRSVSNQVSFPWVVPAPATQPPPTSSGSTAPQIGDVVPVNGAVVTTSTPVTATITAPVGSGIASWSAAIQPVGGSTTTTLASGTGTPPSPLGHLDPATVAPGTYVLTVSATSTSGGSASVGNVVSVGTSGGGTTGQSPPTIAAVSPDDGATVTAPMPINATLTPPAGQTIASWAVTAQALDPGPVITLASGTGTPPSPLTTLDPTVLANDTYAITVSGTASGGGTQSTTTTIAVAGNLKLGRYVTSFEDLNVPVAGLPMQVRRSYDSIDDRVGDFGVGWHLGVSNFRMASNRALGLGGWTEQATQCFFGLCIYGLSTSTPHYVTVTFPDNHQETFDFTPTGGGVLFYWEGSAAFTARPGVTSTLQVDGDSSLMYGFDGNLYDSNFDPFNPTAFILTTADGRVLHLTTTSGLVSETDSQGNTVSVDGTGVHSSTGKSITFARDGSGRITSTTGPSGETIGYAYSAAGDLASVTDAAGNATSYTYDGLHHLLSVSGPGRPQRTLTYDSSGRLTAITDADGNTAQLSSDVGARQQTIQDPNGHLTTVDTFDDAGDLLRQDKAFGTTTQTTSWTYDDLGHLLTQTDPAGGVIRLAYDANGDILNTTDADGHTTTYTRNAFGEPLTVVAPDGTVQESMTYDSRGRLLTHAKADGTSSSYGYDGAGNMVSSTDGLGRTTTRTFDSAGHVLTLKNPAGQVTTYTYDDSGHPLTITDPLGNKTSFAYDGLGDITSIVDPMGRTKTYTYDAVGHTTSATDAAGHTTTYTYDAVGRLAQRVDRSGGTTTYTYDPDSSLLSETLPSGAKTTYTYDPLERPSTVSNAAQTVGYTYNALNAVASQTTTPVGTSGQPTATLQYSYDPAGALLSTTGPDGTTTYAYDADSRLVTLTAPGNQVYGFTYDAAGRLSGETRPNGAADSLAYDAAGELLGRTTVLGSTVVGQASYTYDAAGLRTSLTDLAGTTTYTYDADSQLVTATHPTGSGIPNESYAYNAAGDRIESATDPAGSITYDSAGRLTADAAHTYTYDAEGDLATSVVRSTGAATTYSWDADHRLQAVTHPDGTTSNYTYDGLGRRVQVADPGATTRYVYDGSNVRLEYDGANALQAAYTQTQVVGSVLAQTRNGQSASYVQDGQGSTTALLGSAGTPVASYAYDSFGKQAGSNPSSPSQTYSYTGHAYDSSTGLYYARARYYDPASGRFLSEDPVRGVNDYSYVSNDPTNLVDPMGTQELVEESETMAVEETLDEAAIEGEQSALCEEASAFDQVIGAGESVNQMGSQAEKYVQENFLNGLEKNTIARQGRIPDFINSETNEFFEVKNVGRLSYTSQLRDFVKLAGKDNPVNIFIRAGTKVSGPLAKAELEGKVNLLKCLPG